MRRALCAFQHAALRRAHCDTRVATLQHASFRLLPQPGPLGSSLARKALNVQRTEYNTPPWPGRSGGTWREVNGRHGRQRATQLATCHAAGHRSACRAVASVRLRMIGTQAVLGEYAGCTQGQGVLRLYSRSGSTQAAAAAGSRRCWCGSSFASTARASTRRLRTSHTGGALTGVAVCGPTGVRRTGRRCMTAERCIPRVRCVTGVRCMPDVRCTTGVRCGTRVTLPHRLSVVNCQMTTVTPSYPPCIVVLPGLGCELYGLGKICWTGSSCEYLWATA
jgi:hypothetical protein